MPERHVWTFFYGSYMNFDVLEEANVAPTQWEVARLSGYDLVMGPRANLVPSDRGVAYGIVAACTHAELDRLYAYAEQELGQRYLPEAVLVEIENGSLRPALTYLADRMAEAPADPAYVERIADPARRYGFPSWYVAHIESFR